MLLNSGAYIQEGFLYKLEYKKHSETSYNSANQNLFALQYLTLAFLDTRQWASKWNKSPAQEDKSLIQKKKKESLQKIYPGGKEPLYSFRCPVYKRYILKQNANE